MMWKVVPLSVGQRRDVNPADVLENGLYRLCDSYKGGGGYDLFPTFARERWGSEGVDYSKQFIVQLFGCNLDCPYCYVTREGVWGQPVQKTSAELVKAFCDSGAKVFHLMGGAPALSIDSWPDLIRELHRVAPDAVFHSDLMLTEKKYDPQLLDALAFEMPGKQLYAINSKGLTPEEYERSTRKKFRPDLFWRNWQEIDKVLLPAYMTFTGVNPNQLSKFWKMAEIKGIEYVNEWKMKSYVIPIINYEAMQNVDDITWGGAHGEESKRSDAC